MDGEVRRIFPSRSYFQILERGGGQWFMSGCSKDRGGWKIGLQKNFIKGEGARAAGSALFYRGTGGNSYRRLRDKWSGAHFFLYSEEESLVQ